MPPGTGVHQVSYRLGHTDLALGLCPLLAALVPSLSAALFALRPAPPAASPRLAALLPRPVWLCSTGKTDRPSQSIPTPTLAEPGQRARPNPSRLDFGV
jgi:hypothetical protein